MKLKLVIKVKWLENILKKIFQLPISIFMMKDQEEIKEENEEKQEKKITIKFLVDETEISNKSKVVRKYT